MAKIKKLIERLAYFMALIAAIVMFVDTIYIFFTAISRYFFRKPSAVVIDITGYILFLLTFMSAPWLLKMDKHVKIELFVDKLKGRTKNIIEAISYLICAIVSILLAAGAVKLAAEQYATKAILVDNIKPPKFVFTTLIAVCFMLTTYFSGEKIIEKIKGLTLDRREV